MIMEVRWHHGKTLEQNNMEIANLSLKLAMGDKVRAANNLGISLEQMDKLLQQSAADIKVQKDAQARYDAQRKLAHQRLTAPLPSTQHVQWLDEKPEADLGLQAVGQTPLEPRTESGMSNKMSPVPKRKPEPAKNPPPTPSSKTKATSKRGA
jgi:hypothetical protein